MNIDAQQGVTVHGSEAVCIRNQEKIAKNGNLIQFFFFLDENLFFNADFFPCQMSEREKNNKDKKCYFYKL